MLQSKRKYHANNYKITTTKTSDNFIIMMLSKYIGNIIFKRQKIIFNTFFKVLNEFVWIS